MRADFAVATSIAGRVIRQPFAAGALLCVALHCDGQQPSAGWFTDVAPRSNFSYKTNNDYTGRKYFPQPMCGGVAIFDFDNDGRMDIFLTNGAKLPDLQKTSGAYDNALLRNKGDGTFEDVTVKAGLTGKETGYAFGTAAGDFDNDGNEDLFVASAGRNTLSRNNGDGTFSDVTVGSGLDHKPANLLSVGAAWFDYDNDGLLDLVVSNYTLWNPVDDRPCHRLAGKAADSNPDAKASGNSIESYCSPRDVGSVSPTLYHNLGNGKFEDVTESSGLGAVRGKGMGISIADFNGDGLLDIFIANDTERNFLFINQGGGKFKEEALLYGVAYNDLGSAVSGMGSDANDYNNDGLPDIVYNDLAGQVFGLFKNDKGHYFDDSAAPSGIGKLSRPYAGWSIGFIDYDNDGWKDIYSANGDVDNIGPDAKQHDSMFKNLDGEHFVDTTANMGQDFLFLGYQRGAAFGDLNNDGYTDIVVTSLAQRPRILVNRALSGNHWLLFDLRGTRSNRDAIGAEITVTTASGRALYNHVATSVGFMSSSDRRVSFGLGKETSASSIEIRWPSGIVQTLGPTPADHIVKVVEPVAEMSPHP